ncbi:alpha/beta fold hydrolase [Rhodococcoides yunnanense]|uniref:alpha/beta fold hydrolase n=1 Tax=Rhodococcoides yunnanense TaxID=278209 RepID=UPI00093328B1|nr:alpha/beta fold hydrolase [Rhodococcus yunnanensis]
MANDITVQEWGSGDRHAVLIHGLGNSSGSWFDVGPALADRGYHVHAVDLPGHGDSAPLERYSVEALADAVQGAVPGEPALAVGHSLGGLVLAHAVATLKPAHAVYVDPAWRITPDAAVINFFRSQKTWTLDDVAANFPKWDAGSLERKLVALQKWDVTILDDLGSFTPADSSTPVVPSTVVLADPSNLVPPERATELREAGFAVSTVAGAGHVVHIDDLDGFLEAVSAVIAV